MDNIKSEVVQIEDIKKSKAEKNREYVKANYYKNKEKKLNAINEYRRNNLDKYREYHRNYYHLKIKVKKIEPLLEV